jgi:EmrB/QacA subfamily drug resistance transporter
MMAAVDQTIVATALPAIQHDLHAQVNWSSWTITIYALGQVLVMPLAGKLGDQFGRRRIFLMSVALFTIASLCCGVANDIYLLVVLRALQAIGGGAFMPIATGIVSSQFGSDRDRALGLFSSVFPIGGIIGPILGGVFVTYLSWRWIFLVNVPLGAVLIASGFVGLPQRRTAGGERRHLDVAGAVTVTAGLTALIWALARAEAAGWGSAEVVAGLPAAAFLLAAFGIVETQLSRTPLVPFSVFRSRLVSAGSLLSFLSFVPVMATWFLLSLYLQQVRGYEPLQAGLLFLPLSLAVVAGSQVSFRLVARVDARALFATGALIAAAGLAWLGAVSQATPIAWVVAPATITMAGGGLMFAPITVAATSGVGPDQAGLASGLLNTTRQLGGAVGLAILETIAAAQTMSAGYATAFTAGAAIFALTGAAGAIALPGRLTAYPTSTPRSRQRCGSPIPTRARRRSTAATSARRVSYRSDPPTDAC